MAALVGNEGPALSEVGDTPLEARATQLSPEALVTFGPSFLVSISNAWEAHWAGRYCHEIEALHWFLEINFQALRCQAELAKLMSDGFGSDQKWTYREIQRAVDKDFAKLCGVDDLPESARLCGTANDYRAKYPIPTALFHTRMKAWAQLRANIHIRIHAKAQRYNGAKLPADSLLADGVDWDYVAWQYNRLPKRKS